MSELLTPKQVRELFNVTDTTLYLWRKNNILPFIRIGRTIRYRKTDIRNILNAYQIEKSS